MSLLNTYRKMKTNNHQRMLLLNLTNTPNNNHTFKKRCSSFEISRRTSSVKSNSNAKNNSLIKADLVISRTPPSKYLDYAPIIIKTLTQNEVPLVVNYEDQINYKPAGSINQNGNLLTGFSGGEDKFGDVKLQDVVGISKIVSGIKYD